MVKHLGVVGSNVTDSIEAAIRARLPQAEIEVAGNGGHFTVSVTDKEFEGKSMLQRHRLVMGCLKELMAGANAPVHAIDKLDTKTP